MASVASRRGRKSGESGIPEPRAADQREENCAERRRDRLLFALRPTYCVFNQITAEIENTLTSRIEPNSDNAATKNGCLRNRLLHHMLLAVTKVTANKAVCSALFVNSQLMTDMEKNGCLVTDDHIGTKTDLCDTKKKKPFQSGCLVSPRSTAVVV